MYTLYCCRVAKNAVPFPVFVTPCENEAIRKMLNDSGNQYFHMTVGTSMQYTVKSADGSVVAQVTLTRDV